jgi:hypothetical protein
MLLPQAPNNKSTVNKSIIMAGSILPQDASRMLLLQTLHIN